MTAIMTPPRMPRIPAIALVVVLTFSLAGQALAAQPPTPPAIQGDSTQGYIDRGISQSANSGVAPAKAASGDCGCWIDAKTGKQVPSVPISGANLVGDPANAGAAGVAQMDGFDPKAEHAFNSKTGQNFYHQPNGCWIDTKTGKQVPTAPISGANLVGDPANAGAAGVAQMDGFDPKADHAFNSKTGQNFARVPCPPPTASKPKDGVKTASADSSVPAQDKSHYNLFNMTPPGLRRPFYTDYGALSPYTIDAGAYAADVSFGYGYRERSGDMVERTYTSWNYGNMWLKAGLLNNLDLEVGVQPWQTRTLTVKDPTGHDSMTRSGFGDLLTRVKLNVLNNDGGPAALSFAATMKWPTANTHLMRHDNYEGGLSAQFRYQDPCGIDMRINSGFMLSESDRGCWESCFNNRIAFYHAVPFVADLSALAAFNSDVSNARRSDWEGEFQTGFIYQPTPNFQVFIGSTFGVNGKVNDFGPSVSMDLRFP